MQQTTRQTFLEQVPFTPNRVIGQINFYDSGCVERTQQWMTGKHVRPSRHKVVSVMIALQCYSPVVMADVFETLAGDKRLTPSDWRRIVDSIHPTHKEFLSSAMLEPTFPVNIIPEYVLACDIVALRNAMKRPDYQLDDDTWHQLITTYRPMVTEEALLHVAPTRQEVDLLLPNAPTYGLGISWKPYLHVLITRHGNLIFTQQWATLIASAHPSMIETISLSVTAPAWVLNKYAEYDDPYIRRNIAQNISADEATRVTAALSC
jgi:hypothetical protein